MCGTKLFFEGAKWPGETHVPLAAFDDPVDRAPQGHAFYAGACGVAAGAQGAARRRDRAREQVTGIVLAGGQGRRMGGVDKGLVELDGQPMVAHVLARLAPQVGDVLINANQNLERYAAFGYPVVPRRRRRLRRAARRPARRH